MRRTCLAPLGRTSFAKAERTQVHVGGILGRSWFPHRDQCDSGLKRPEGRWVSCAADRVLKFPVENHDTSPAGGRVRIRAPDCFLVCGLCNPVERSVSTWLSLSSHCSTS